MLPIIANENFRAHPQKMRQMIRKVPTDRSSEKRRSLSFSSGGFEQFKLARVCYFHWCSPYFNRVLFNLTAAGVKNVGSCRPSFFCEIYSSG